MVIKVVPRDDTNLDHESGYRIGGDAIISIAVDEDSIWCGTMRHGLIRYLKSHTVSANDEGMDKNGQ